jgi:hypothetical protein
VRVGGWSMRPLSGGSNATLSLSLNHTRTFNSLLYITSRLTSLIQNMLDGQFDQ